MLYSFLIFVLNEVVVCMCVFSWLYVVFNLLYKWLVRFFLPLPTPTTTLMSWLIFVFCIVFYVCINKSLVKHLCTFVLYVFVCDCVYLELLSFLALLKEEYEKRCFVLCPFLYFVFIHTNVYVYLTKVFR